MGRITIASQFDEDSELLERFKEFEEETGYGNRSKAVRACMRRGLDQYDDEGRKDGQRAFTAIEGSLLTLASVIAGVVLFLPLLAVFGVAPMSTVLGVGAAYLATAAAIALAVSYGLFRRSGPAVEAKEVSG